MFEYLNQVGMFGLPLLLLFAGIVVLTIRYGLQIFKSEASPKTDPNLILFLGAFALILGMFSHYLGVFQGMQFAGQMAPEQLAAGFRMSMVALFYGFGIFFISSLSWIVLRTKLKASYVS